jgi:hypothetical protein
MSDFYISTDLIQKSLTHINQLLLVNLKDLFRKAQENPSLSFNDLQFLILIRDVLGDLKSEIHTVCTIREVAQALGKSKRTIYYYKAQGMPVTDRGDYDIHCIRQWLARRPPRNNKTGRVLTKKEADHSFPHRDI